MEPSLEASLSCSAGPGNRDRASAKSGRGIFAPRLRRYPVGMVEIADAVAHRALRYVEAVNRQGHRLTIKEFEAYVARPERESRTVGGLSSLVLSQSLAALSGFGGTTKHEFILDWLKRVKWLSVRELKVSLTPLGAAVLRELDAQGVDFEGPSIIVLTAANPFAYAEVVSAVSKAGTELLADPYLQLSALPMLLANTSVKRILVSPEADIVGLKIADPEASENQVAIRVSADFHDRFAIPTSGEVLNLGTSLNGFGKRLSVITPISPPGANEIRTAYEDLWGKADELTAWSGGKGVPTKTSSARRKRVVK